MTINSNNIHVNEIICRLANVHNSFNISVKDCQIRPHMFPYTDLVLPYKAIHMPYKGMYVTVFSRLSRFVSSADREK